jgi:hypothetical protein
MVKMKLMYFTMGLDQQALRRTAVIQADKHRFHLFRTTKAALADPTGFKRSRTRQILQWHRRIQYQEYFMQHLFTRETWRVLRKYPVGGAKIDGVANQPYFGYHFHGGLNPYTREALPAEAKELYARRKLDFSKNAARVS